MPEDAPSEGVLPSPWDELRERLRRLPRRRIRFPGTRPAAVLVPLFERAGELHLVLTRRPETLRSHAGQVAFPGGKLDPQEESLQAALREAREELSIPPAKVETFGALHDVLVGVTGYVMTPWVGRIPAGLQLVPNPGEVARVFEVPLRELSDPACTEFKERPRLFKGRSYSVPYFSWRDELIWGATGRVVLDLLRILDQAPRS